MRACRACRASRPAALTGGCGEIGCVSRTDPPGTRIAWILRRAFHDALERDASQRPAAEGQVKPPARHVERLRIMHGEADSVAKVAREGLLGLGHRVGVGIEGVDARRARDDGRQPPGSAADLDNLLAVQVDDPGDGRRLSALAITNLDLGSSPTSSTE